MKSNIETFAERELALLGEGEDEMQAAMNSHLLRMVKTFADEGYSGFSASYAVECLERLLRFLPLSSIEDAPDDWNDVGEGSFQHKRCSRVFKDAGRQAYDIEGKVFSDDGGKTWFISRDGFVPVVFPYFVPMRPKRYLVERDPHGNIVKETEVAA